MEFMASVHDDYLALAAEIFMRHGAEAPCARKGDEILAAFCETFSSPMTGERLSPLTAAICSALDLREEAVSLAKAHVELFEHSLCRRYQYCFHVGIKVGEASRLRRIGESLEYAGSGPIGASDLCASDTKCAILVDKKSFDLEPDLKSRFVDAQPTGIFTKRGWVDFYHLRNVAWSVNKCLFR